MLYSMLATSGNAVAKGVLIGVLVFCGLALLIALCVGLKKGIRRVSWLGVTWLTAGLSFCILHAKIGGWFTRVLKPLTDKMPLAGSAKAFLPPLILASICLLVCLLIHGTVALFLRRPRRRKLVDKKADIFVRDDDWIEYDDESEDYDDYEQCKARGLVQRVGYSKNGNFGFYTPPVPGEGYANPTVIGRIFGGLACMLNCAMILASVLLFTLFVLQATPFRDTTFKPLFSIPAIPKLVTFTKDYALDFLMIGIAVGFLLSASKKGFAETLRSLIVNVGGIVLVALCFYIPFSKIAKAPADGGVWFFHKIVDLAVSASRGMAGKYAPIVGGIFAGLGMSIMVIILLVLINLGLRSLVDGINSAKPLRVIDSVLAVLLYFVVAVGVCLLFWAVFTVFTHFGLLHTMFFTDKSTLAGGFFEVCQAYVEPWIMNVEKTLTSFFAKLGA